MATGIYLLWFMFSRAVTYIGVLGVWAMCGLLATVGGPGRPPPTDEQFMAWIGGTIVLALIMILYTKYNIKILARTLGIGAAQLVETAVVNYAKGQKIVRRSKVGLPRR